jgi:hypothetical protein
MAKMMMIDAEQLERELIYLKGRASQMKEEFYSYEREAMLQAVRTYRHIAVLEQVIGRLKPLEKI